MDRRNFLKFVGLGAAAAVVPKTTVAAIPVKTLQELVMNQVIDPRVIIETDPKEYKRFDLNNDVSSMAGFLTIKLCENYLDKEYSIKTCMAMLRYSLVQPAGIGMILAKKVVNVVLNKMDKNTRIKMARAKEFEVMFNKWGGFMSCDNSVADQYWRLSARIAS